ncbi:Cullin repeat-like-containing domain protein [Lipomyces japonicus]|uniref:Cullin repeat-like-containing domain protein n=1 Tax=Lipomyces japonicus TaxID=56871 RepID=UPI0034CE6B21
MSRPGLLRSNTGGLNGQSNASSLSTFQATATLEAALSKANDITDKIALSLNRLGGASVAIENAIKPISGSSQLYSNIKKNLDATASELEVLRSRQSVYDEEEPRIKRGNLEVTEYYQSIVRINDAIKALESSNLKSSQQVTLKMKQLINAAVSNVREKYRKTLLSVSQVLLEKESSTSTEFTVAIPGSTLQSLSVMVDFFMTTDMSVTVPIYADIRGKYITHNLSVLAGAVVKNDVKRVGGYYVKGSNSAFTSYLQAITSVIIEEDKNVKAIFKTKNDVQVALQDTTSELEKSYHATMLTVDVAVKKNVIADCLYGFDVLEQVHAANGELLLSTDSNSVNLETAIKELRKTAQDALPDMLRHVETSVTSLANLPTDFAILEITKDTTDWILRLEDYDTILASVLTSLGNPSSWPLRLNYGSTFNTAPGTSGKNSYTGTELLSLFISELVDDLLINIEAKARTQYRKVTRVGLQVLANLLWVERGLRSSREITSILMTSSGFDRLEKLKKRALNMFMDGWKNLAGYLMDVTVVRTNSVSSGHSSNNHSKGLMSSKDREVIKEKFRNFNTDLDELVAKFKEYKIADPELRSFLVKEVAFISPLYHRFYEKHKAGEFSKHTEKYIKYTRAQLDQVLTSLA